MGTNQKNTPTRQSEQDDQKAQFKQFVEGTAAAREHPARKDEKATGTHQYMDEQNKLIDQHNLRK
ncbi:hypothetical protein SY83_21325 [Paenibacillus swuensis]|uniref:Uncharacterized protein n=1 Tax=Paenibacillus swuensis TaxID=1178515 RepID=A0A172TMY8_9BACL|nr:hypothetical protein [Paenibacillus swuensis]ANE48398.1 hypothetical protein SY83_21325 [Paenibacillus swuensis]